MVTVNRYSEYLHNNQPEVKQIYVFGRPVVIKENRTGWKIGLLLENGEAAWFSNHPTKADALNKVGYAVGRYIGHAPQSINENNAPDWLKALSTDIIDWHDQFFDLGVLQTIQPYVDGIELEYTDSQYSEKLDDLGFDHTLDSELYIDIVFRGIPEDTERLITMGLQEVPDDYEIQIFAEYSAENKSIFGFKYNDSKKWYFDQEDLAKSANGETTVNGIIRWAITTLITRWYWSKQSLALNKLEKLAASVRKNQD
jgi:hypothetical protein